MRIDLDKFQPGAYAEILDRIPWKVLKTVVKPVLTITPEETDKVNELTLKTMVRFWNVKNASGEAVPIPKDATGDQLDMVDGMIIAAILGEIINLTKQVMSDVNSGNASST